MIAVIFWGALGLIAYTYFGYPATLYLISWFRSNPVQRGPIRPRVSLIIAAYNEESGIREKIENTLGLDYPSESREIIVTSDGSTDKTNDIVASYKSSGVRLVDLRERKGKERAQWAAIQVATGDILVFSDVATIIERNALLRIVSNFRDPAVGCVSSEDKLLSDTSTTDGEGFYVKYEMFLRQLESQVNSLVGLSGSFFAARRELCQDWSFDKDSDFLMAFHAVKKGYRAVADPTAIGFYRAVSTHHQEFRRKVRTVLRGISGVMGNLDVLDPLKYGLFAFQVFSHKLLRWLVPVCMGCAFVSNLILLSVSGLYQWLLVGQIMFYVAATLGLLVKQFGRHILFKVPAFFTLVNASIAVAWVQYLTGHRVVQWEPSRR